MKKLSLIAAAVVSACLTSSAYATPTFDFHGYFRSGLGLSKGGSQTSYQLKNVGRLGNEKDTYAELEFGSELYKKDALSFYVDSMVSMVSDGSNDNEDTSRTDKDQAKFGLRQLNLQVKGLFDFDPEAVVWAGKRYYQRHDIHIIDYKYWDVSGSGAGLEYLSLGPGKLSLAWVRKQSNDIDYRYDDNDDISSNWAAKRSVNINFFDARYALSPWDGGWAEFGVDYAVPRGTSISTENGTASPGYVYYDNNSKTVSQFYDNGNSFMLTALLSQNFKWGWNETVLQFSNKGLAHHAVDGDGSWYDNWSKCDDAKGYNIINHGDINFTKDFHLTHVVSYGIAKDLSSTLQYSTRDYLTLEKRTLARFVVRPWYQLTPNTKAYLEAGTYVMSSHYDDGTHDIERGHKVTLAYAIAPDLGYKSRPELRFFVSYLHARDYDKGHGVYSYDYDSTNYPITYKRDYCIGVQAEAWW